MKLTISVDSSLVIIKIYLVCLIYLGLEKKILKEIMHFHYITYMATLYHKNPCPWGHEIYNLGWPLLGHHCYAISYCELCLGVEKRIFKEINQFFTFLPQNYLSLGWGVVTFTISCLLPLQMLHTKFGQDWPSGFWEEYVNGWPTLHDGWQWTQPIGIGHQTYVN